MGSSAVWSWRRLAADEAALACPLMMATGGALPPVAWTARVHRWNESAAAAGGGTGVLTARRGIIIGVFHFLPRDGHTLDVPMVRVIELHDRRRTASALLEVLEMVAVELGCSRLRLSRAQDPCARDAVPFPGDLAGELGFGWNGGAWTREIAAAGGTTAGPAESPRARQL